MNIVKIETLGCRLNQIESEAAGRFFLDNQFIVDMTPTAASTEESGEVCLSILNTCTVTQKAEQKARRIIRLMLKKYPKSAVLVTGCYAQLSQEEILKIDKRICVIGGQIKSRIENVPAILKSFIGDRKSPTGGLANGIPLKDVILGSAAGRPSIFPSLVSTSRNIKFPFLYDNFRIRPSFSKKNTLYINFFTL